MHLDAQLEKIIKQQAKYESGNLGLNLLIARLQRKYAANPTPPELKSCVGEMKAFFDKYAMISKNDIEAIKRL